MVKSQPPPGSTGRACVPSILSSRRSVGCSRKVPAGPVLCTTRRDTMYTAISACLHEARGINGHGLEHRGACGETQLCPVDAEHAAARLHLDVVVQMWSYRCGRLAPRAPQRAPRARAPVGPQGAGGLHINASTMQKSSARKVKESLKKDKKGFSSQEPRVVSRFPVESAI
eukprot:gene14073-biopygen4006